jgi:anti-sigma regulatory factor (Ser/Thr protein kinase)
MERLFQYRNDIQEISRIGSDLSRLAAEWSIPDSERRQVTVIVEELLSNIIRFAFRDSHEHLVQVKISQNDRVLSIRITDDGMPFNPMNYHPVPITDPASPDTGGMGIILVRTFSDAIEYRRTGNRNQIHITKIIKSKS